MTIMRYRVQFDKVARKWAVIDTYRMPLPMLHCATKEEARSRAWWEEQRWFKCTTDRDVSALS